ARKRALDRRRARKRALRSRWACKRALLSRRARKRALEPTERNSWKRSHRSTNSPSQDGALRSLSSPARPSPRCRFPLLPPPPPLGPSRSPLVGGPPAGGPQNPARRLDRKPSGRLVVIVEDGSEGRSFSLGDGQLDIGRVDGDIILEDDHYVSPRHARLRFVE